MKKLIVIIGMMSFFIGNSNNLNAAKMLTYPCAEVLFSCGATGHVCGNAQQSLVERAWELDADICG